MQLTRRLRQARDLYRELRWWAAHAPQVRQSVEETRARQGQILRAVEVLQDREIENRSQLRSLRASAEYERAFAEEEPLVSVTIPTWTNYRALTEIAIPSILAQTYENFEIVVIGDAAPPETERALASIGDPRITYANFPHRGLYPEDPTRRWYVAGVPAINEASRLARGSWIAPQNDDDEFTPDHIDVLLTAARKSRSEVAYGRFVMQFPEREAFVAGTYPPEYGQFTWQCAIQHAGLRFFEMELGDAWFDRPGDWSVCRRMLLAGVRFTMIDDIVARLYPARTGHPELLEHE